MLDELKYSQLGKFQVLTEPLQIVPMKCAGCGRFSSGNPNEPLQFIDMGFSLDFYGEILICVQGCFRESMNQLGVLTKEQTDDIKLKISESDKEVAKLRIENKELRNAVDALNRISNHLASVSPSVVTVAREENKPVVSTKINPKPAGRKEGSIKQTNVGGSTGVSNDESNDLLGEI